MKILLLMFVFNNVFGQISFDKAEEINGLNKSERIGQIEGKFKDVEVKLAKISELTIDQEKFKKSISELKEEIKKLKEELNKNTEEMNAKALINQKAKDIPVSLEDLNFLKRENEILKNGLDELRRSMGILRQRIESLEKDSFKR